MNKKEENTRISIHPNLSKNIRDLLNKNIYSELGYRKALGCTSHLQLRSFLQQQSFLHARFATELSGLLHNLNAGKEAPSDLLPRAHRAWINFGSSLKPGADKFVLEECLRGERVCIREYEQKLRSSSFPPNIALLLWGQKKVLVSNVSEIASLHDLP